MVGIEDVFDQECGVVLGGEWEDTLHFLVHEGLHFHEGLTDVVVRRHRVRILHPEVEELVRPPLEVVEGDGGFPGRAVNVIDVLRLVEFDVLSLFSETEVALDIGITQTPEFVQRGDVLEGESEEERGCVLDDD